MTLDTFVVIACLVGCVVCGLGYRYFSGNVRLHFKDQRIPTEVTR